mmetsp:Transcript_32071/g.67046  ORF Transcript_32071/g.67046 Transcript_32071/m.67046 type:complete len:146 (-) Transcript_32071:96-533(-)
MVQLPRKQGPLPRHSVFQLSEHLNNGSRDSKSGMTSDYEFLTQQRSLSSLLHAFTANPAAAARSAEAAGTRSVEAAGMQSAEHLVWEDAGGAQSRCCFPSLIFPSLIPHLHGGTINALPCHTCRLVGHGRKRSRFSSNSWAATSE